VAAHAVHVGKEAGAEDVSLEGRIASLWFNRVGILAMLLGVAWFLKMAFDRHWLGPTGRVGCGLMIGGALMLWSEWFRRRGYYIFSYSLKALGSGTLYLSVWAAFGVYELVSAAVALAAMSAVTALIALLAWRQDSEMLALFALVGGFATPGMLSTGQNHELTLFSYLLVLCVAVLVLVGLRPWSRLLFLAFVGAASYVYGWWYRFYTAEQFGWTAFFVVTYLLLFAFAPRIIRLREMGEGKTSKWDLLVVVVLPLVNAALAFTALYTMCEMANDGAAEPWIALGMGGLYLLLLWLPEGLWLRKGSDATSTLNVVAAVGFVTLALFLREHGRWLTACWLVEGAGLLWAATRVRLGVMKALALGVLLLGLDALLVWNPDASPVPVWNQRFAVYCLGVAVFAYCAWLGRRQGGDVRANLISYWPLVASSASLVVSALVLLAVGLEIRNYWWVWCWAGDDEQYHRIAMLAQFSYSAWIVLFGVVVLAVGLWKRSRFLRWQALAVLAMAVGKVFLVDVSQLSQGYRILSFLGLGAMLLGVSLVYQRKWLQLRRAKAE